MDLPIEELEEQDPIDGMFTDLGAAVMVPPRWIIDDLLPPGLTFIGAPPKAGKSTMTMALALLTAGVKCKAMPDFMSVCRSDGPVHMYSFEATAGELRHMAEVGLQCKVPADESILICDDPWKFRLDDPGGLDLMLGWLKAREPRLVIIDPLRDFHQLEEKDSGGMNRLLRPLRQWAIENDSSITVVHHTKKKDDDSQGYNNNDLRGTSALFGIADAVLILSPVGTTGATKIKATYKRAKGWERTITFSSYEKAGTVSSEELEEIDIMVKKAVEIGIKVPRAIAAQLHVSETRVAESLTKLRRNGHLWLKASGDK